MAKKEANGSAKSSGEQAAPAAAVTDIAPPTEINPELAAKIAAVRTHIRESFGKVVMAMMMLPRYRSQTLADLQHLVLEPLMRDRVAIAYPGGDKAGPLAEDWNSGDINWLLDVIAPDQRTTANVIANFKQVVKEGSLRLHPIVTRLVDAETLQKMGAEKMGAPASAEREEATVN